MRKESINKEETGVVREPRGRVWLRLRPLEPAKRSHGEKGLVSGHSARLSKYRNDNLWFICPVINGLKVVDLSTSYIRLEREAKVANLGSCHYILLKIGWLPPLRCRRGGETPPVGYDSDRSAWPNGSF